jgi:hypothetical protein
VVVRVKRAPKGNEGAIIVIKETDNAVQESNKEVSQS